MSTQDTYTQTAEDLADMDRGFAEQEIERAERLYRLLATSGEDHEMRRAYAKAAVHLRCALLELEHAEQRKAVPA